MQPDSTVTEPLRPARGAIGVTLAEFAINRHDFMRVDIALCGDKPVIQLSRWKNTPAGEKRTGQAFAFAGHRLPVIQKLLAEASTALEQHFSTDTGAPHDAP